MVPATPALPAAQPVLRFAPSPNGLLHLGHAYSALMNQRTARRLGGRLRLRFEDIDPVRCRPEFVTEAEADLAWLGIDIAPPVLHQSRRSSAYAAAIVTLEHSDFLYPCFCSRGDVARAIADRPGWRRDPDGAPLYPGTCRRLDADERERRRALGLPSGLRLDMAAALEALPALPHGIDWLEYGEGEHGCRVPADPAEWGDVLLARKEIATSYHLSVVVDDAAQGVTDVVRGVDLRPATSLHRLLQLLLGHPAPRYRHHRLVCGPDGAKLSKSRGAPSLRDLRNAGVAAEAVRHDLGFDPADNGVVRVPLA